MVDIIGHNNTNVSPQRPKLIYNNVIYVELSPRLRSRRRSSFGDSEDYLNNPNSSLHCHQAASLFSHLAVKRDRFWHGQKKPRIFLAYEARSTKYPGDEPYHVALMVRPHPLDTEAIDTLRLHAMNKVQPPTPENPEARQVWVFEMKDTKFLTDRLSGLLYLGKLPKGKSIDDVKRVCASVPVEPPGEVGWRCTNWVWEAMQRLADESLIPPLPCSSKELHGRGRDCIYDMKQKQQDPLDIVSIDTQMQLQDFSI
ncbi:hypothetical protein EIP86_005038 [Pleurotus ostreatoroseus]|nr:hypothetical protein EIP86_005038 [Pleurotus ostreatoroseus]